MSAKHMCSLPGFGRTCAAALALALACVAAVAGLSIKPASLLEQRALQSSGLQGGATTVPCPQSSSVIIDAMEKINQDIGECQTFTDSQGNKWEVRGLKPELLPLDVVVYSLNEGYSKSANLDGCMISCNDINAGKGDPAWTWKPEQPKQCGGFTFKKKPDGSAYCQVFTTKIATVEAWASPTWADVDIAFPPPAGTDAAGNGAVATGGAGTDGAGPTYEMNRSGGDLDISTTVNIKP